MKLANIVSINTPSVSDTINVVKTMDEIIHGLPTLIIGYDYINKHYPDFDITNISLGPDLYWTFKRTERRDKYDEDLNWFISKIYIDLIKDISYIFVDPLQYNKKTLVKIIKKIKSLENKISYINDEMVYIYGEKYIFGVDLKLLKYMSIDSTKIKNKIKQISTVFLDDNNILIEYKKSVGMLGTQVRYIPYLYSITNGQNNSSSLIHIPRES